MSWTINEVPNSKGKTIIVTGGNSGLGFETIKQLASKEATLILAARNMDKGNKALHEIKSIYPDAMITLMSLDLSDLNSVRSFADSFLEKFSQLDGLINNAGIMMPPYSKTKDNFELQFGTNHLGPFALTGLLLPILLSTKDSRVVTVSSVAAKRGKIHFSNLTGSEGYNNFQFYAQSKLANVLFAKELNQYLSQNGHSTKSFVCHPGVSRTNLFQQSPFGWRLIERSIGQPAEMGCLPTLYALTESNLSGGEFVGPEGLFGFRGYPKIDKTGETLYNSDISKKLWKLSEEQTGVTYSF